MFGSCQLQVFLTKAEVPEDGEYVRGVQLADKADANYLCEFLYDVGIEISPTDDFEFAPAELRELRAAFETARVDVAARESSWVVTVGMPESKRPSYASRERLLTFIDRTLDCIAEAIENGKWVFIGGGA